MTTQEIDDRIAELEAIPTGMAIQFVPARLSEDAIWLIVRWSELVRDNSIALADWLRGIAATELLRRQSEEAHPIDTGVLRLPTNWNNADLAAALGCCFGLCESCENRELIPFLRKVTGAIVVLVQNRLRNNPNSV